MEIELKSGEIINITSKFLHLEGVRKGRLLVGKLVSAQKGKYVYECLCDCGNICLVNKTELNSGNTKSCGCLAKELSSVRLKTRITKHGYSRTKAYHAWADAKQRCYNENHPEYKRYGALGIEMSDDFLNNPKAWCEYLGEPPDTDEKWSVDRVDPTKNYEIGNLRWATPPQQVRNRKKQANNVSGITGVWHSTNAFGTESINAFVNDLDGKPITKSWSINKWGLEYATFIAAEWRDIQIRRLNLLGAGYTEQHGK